MSVDNSRPTAVVTGASAGIGKGVAINLVENGWNVCLIARSVDKMTQIASNYQQLPNNRIKIIKCDVTEPSQIISACKQIKLWSNDNLNLLLNNVGGTTEIGSNLKSITIADWNSDINLNLRSSFIFTQKLLSSLKFASKHVCQYNDGIYDGNVVNISSVCAKDASSYNISIAYSVSKAGLNQLTRLNAMELAEDKIRVNALSLGIVPSYALDRFVSEITSQPGSKSVPNIVAGLSKLHPLGKLGTHDDISNMIKFLSNKKQSGWITGAIIDLDGGLKLHGATGFLSNL